MPNMQDFEWPYNGSDAREQAEDEGENLMRKVEELDELLRQEREAREHLERVCQSQRQLREELCQEIKQERERAEQFIAHSGVERQARERAEDKLSRLLDWITQGQMSGCNYTYEAMHQAVESAFIEAVRQQEERAERAERDLEELREALRLNMASFKKASEDSGGCPFTCNTDDCQDCIHARAEREARRALGGE